MSKELKITPPEGYEVDKENSTFDKIVFKEVKNKYPIKIEEVKGRQSYISANGRIFSNDITNDRGNVSTKERAEAFLALMQLVELRDAWNKVDGVTIKNTDNTNEYLIGSYKNEIVTSGYFHANCVLSFGSKKTRDLFLKTFKDLIERAKELI